MFFNSKRVLAVASVTTLLTGLGVAAFGVDDAKEVRQSDFLPTLSDTRSTGHMDFLEEGLGVWTETNTSTDKVAEYFAVSKPLTEGVANEPTLSWRGSLDRPGMQLGVDLNNDGAFDGILVGEPRVYSNRWWANNQLNTFLTNDAGNTAPGAGDGYDHSGPLADWSAAYPNANVVAYGFSLGSGLKGDGVITRMTFGTNEYIFTDEENPTSAPAMTTLDVTASGTWSNVNRLARFTMKSAAQPANDTGRGTKVRWSIYVEGTLRYTSTNGWGDETTWQWAFAKGGKNQKVEVKRNGASYSTKYITTK